MTAEAKQLLAATSLAEVLPTHSLVSGEGSSFGWRTQPARWRSRLMRSLAASRRSRC